MKDMVGIEEKITQKVINPAQLENKLNMIDGNLKKICRPTI